MGFASILSSITHSTVDILKINSSGLVGEYKSAEIFQFLPDYRNSRLNLGGALTIPGRIFWFANYLLYVQL